MKDPQPRPSDIARLNSSVLERQLLLQLGDRLKRLRQAQGLGTVEMAERVGIFPPHPARRRSRRSRPLDGNVPASHVRPGRRSRPRTAVRRHPSTTPPGSAAARSRRSRPLVQVTVTPMYPATSPGPAEPSRCMSMAVRLVRADPKLVQRAQDTLQRWLSAGDSRSSGLWREWHDILLHRSWRKVLGRTRRAQELRQASPLVGLLPDEVRRDVLSQVRRLKGGIELRRRGTQGGAHDAGGT